MGKGSEAGGAHQGLPVQANPALTIRSGGGVLPIKHSTLPPSPLTANCTASLEMIGGPTGRRPGQATQISHQQLQVHSLPDRSRPLKTLTIDIKWNLPLSHSNSRHDGPAGIDAGVCLGH